MISNVSSSQTTQIAAHNQKILKPEAKHSKDIIADNSKQTAGAQEPKNISVTQATTMNRTPKASIDMKA
jgi:hypothetical protein